MDDDTRKRPADLLPDADTLSVTEIAEALGLHQATIRVWVRDKLLDAEKQGRKWMIRRDDVIALLDAQPHLGKPHRGPLRERRDQALAETRPSGRLHGSRALATSVIERGLL